MIRRLTHEDAAPFRDLRHLGLEHHPEAFATGADAWRSPLDAAVIATLGSADAPGDRFVLGALGDGRLVGLLGFKREGRASLRHKGTLWGFFVHPEHRRRGHGTGLLDAALAELRGVEGLGYVRIVVTTTNTEALRLFVAHGFVQFGMETGGLHLDGRFFDQAFLRLDLAPQGSVDDKPMTRPPSDR